jgi:site-specific DNA-methyltransferase (adenine-specific)
MKSTWDDALSESGLTLKTPIVWDKGNWSAGDLEGDYGNQVELVLFAHKGRHIFTGGRPANLWPIPRPLAGEHPTPKPVALMARCIETSSVRGDVICDPFMGTGPTGVACARLGRRFIGIEIDERYFEIACRRIEEAQRQPDLFVPNGKPNEPEAAYERDIRDLFSERSA